MTFILIMLLLRKNLAIVLWKVSNSQINLNKDGIYTSTITGNLKIKGISKQVMTTGSFVVAENRVKGVASFYAIPKDFNISIPSYIMTDISKKIKINVNIDFPIP